MEKVLELINRNCISLNDDYIKESNEKLKSIIEEQLIPKMKERCPLFCTLYNGIAFGGSYYDGLKIDRPDEFDLDIKLTLMNIPCKIHGKKKCISCIKIYEMTDNAGYLWFQLDKDFNDSITKKFTNGDGYILNDKVLKSWFKGLVNGALHEITNKKSKENDITQGEVKFHSQSGPALTLKLETTFGPICVDLVPAFRFDGIYWPKSFRESSCDINDFLLVPKEVDQGMNKSWRASFQRQEQAIIRDKEKLKPSLKLLKKMRNSLNHTLISSYFLKTLVLWDIETKSFNWENDISLSNGFKHLVTRYIDSLRKKEIPYYWAEENNFLSSKKSDTTLNDFHNEVVCKFEEIKLEPDNPYAITKLILKEGSVEYNCIIKEMREHDDNYNISKYNSYVKMETDLNYIVSTYLSSDTYDIILINSIINRNLKPGKKEFNWRFDGKTFIDENLFNNFTQYTFYNIVIACNCQIRNCDCLTICKTDSKSRNLRLKHKFIGDVTTTEVLSWIMDSCIPSGFVEHDGDMFYLTSILNHSENSVTLTIESVSNTKEIDVNIVPAFKLNLNDLPDHLRSNTSQFSEDKSDVFVIPRQVLNNNPTPASELYWWPCFHDQECDILKNGRVLKSAFKLIKKSRTLEHSEISNYALKTILLTEKHNIRENSSLSDTFMHLLRKYKDVLADKKISYYWRNNINLLKSLSLDGYYDQIEQNLKEIIEAHYNNPENPLVIAKFILGEDSTEYEDYFQYKNHDCNKNEIRNDLNGDVVSFNAPVTYRSYSNPDNVDIVSPRRSRQETVDNGNGWLIAAGVLGAAAVISFGIWGATRNNNRQ